MTNEKTIEDILKELVAAQKEANEINRALLKHIVDRDENNNIHKLASALASMRFVRDEYNLLVEDLRKDIDNESMRGVVDDLGELFGTLASAVHIGNGNLSLAPSDVLVKKWEKQKAEQPVDPAWLQGELTATKGEVVSLKYAHTWEQERAAIVAMLLNPNAPLRSSMHYAEKIQRGEHWPAERDKS